MLTIRSSCPHCGGGTVMPELTDYFCLNCGWRSFYHGWDDVLAEQDYRESCALISQLRESPGPIKIRTISGVMKF